MQLIVHLLEFLSFLVYIYVIISLFPSIMRSGFGITLRKIIEPFLNTIRSIIPTMGGLDFSPIILWILIQLAIVGMNNITSLI